MSFMANKVLSILDELFPANPHKRVFSEYYTRFKGHRLFFDFYVKELNVFVEVQGGQHKKFIKHFHGDAENFHKQKLRDNLKIEYVQKNDMYLVRFYDNEDITKELVLEKINNAFDSEYNFCD